MKQKQKYDLKTKMITIKFHLTTQIIKYEKRSKVSIRTLLCIFPIENFSNKIILLLSSRMTSVFVYLKCFCFCFCFPRHIERRAQFDRDAAHGRLQRGQLEGDARNGGLRGATRPLGQNARLVAQLCQHQRAPSGECRQRCRRCCCCCWWPWQP